MHVNSGYYLTQLTIQCTHDNNKVHCKLTPSPPPTNKYFLILPTGALVSFSLELPAFCGKEELYERRRGLLSILYRIYIHWSSPIPSAKCPWFRCTKTQKRLHMALPRLHCRLWVPNQMHYRIIIIYQCYHSWAPLTENLVVKNTNH